MAESPLADPAFDPFRRTDVYGYFGLSNLPILEYIRLAILGCTVLPIKFAGCLSCILSCYLSCMLSKLVPLPYRKQTVSTLALVSNHISWVDILLYMSRYFPSFVARAATLETPLVGVISANMDCIFVDREKRSNSFSPYKGISDKVKQRMLQATELGLDLNQPLVLFPEGTTTNGKYLLPFKTGAFLAGKPVKPIVLKYGQGHVSPAWESITAGTHILLMLCNPLHTVIAYEFPTYVPSSEEASNPALFAAGVRKHMLQQSGLRPSSSTLKEKMEFHALLRGEIVMKKTH